MTSQKKGITMELQTAAGFAAHIRVHPTPDIDGAGCGPLFGSYKDEGYAVIVYPGVAEQREGPLVFIKEDDLSAYLLARGLPPIDWSTVFAPREEQVHERMARVFRVTWDYSPVHSKLRANAIAIAVAGRLNEHVYVPWSCGDSRALPLNVSPHTMLCDTGEIDLFFAVHEDCTCSDEELYRQIKATISPLAEHTGFSVQAPTWRQVPKRGYYDGRTYTVVDGREVPASDHTR
jgi:hypothetical protein